MEENVIKPHLVKPLLEKVVYEKMQLPQQNAVINIKPEDSIDVRKVGEEVVKATLTRTLVISPANLMKLAVTMSVEILWTPLNFQNFQTQKGTSKTANQCEF